MSFPDRPKNAYVTLLTSDSYLAGALTALHSIVDLEPIANLNTFETVCLVTPSTVGHRTIKALRDTFDCVIGVEPIETKSWDELKLLGRPDLSKALSKLHVFRLTQYSKIVFFDADVLALRPLSSLFAIEQPFAAAPDSGWPDSFNSGLMVFQPSEAAFEGLIEMMRTRGSWDGGDQGLLNDYFPDWHRLSFTFNVTPSAYYTYAPAYRRHGTDISLLHFIGKDKPWNRGLRETYVPDEANTDYYGLVQQWFDVYERHFGLSQTYVVADKVLPPPVSFRSTYTDLAPMLKVTQPTPIPSPQPPEGEHKPIQTWDGTKAAPPHDPHAYQMRVAITDHYDNIWDDPSKRKQRVRFDAPETFPVVPPSTHEWYAEVMKQKPDPKAVKPVFPWEAGHDDQPAAPSPPPMRQFEPVQHAPAPTPPPVALKNPSFVNAWDANPAIERYARNLSFSGKTRKESPPQTEPGSPAPTKPKRDDLGGRQSSLTEPPALRSDASSRDGDDEDDDEPSEHSEDEDDRDRIQIRFRQRSASSGIAVPEELSPTNTRSARGQSSGSEHDYFNKSSGSSGEAPTSPKPRKDSRYVPTSPRQSRYTSSGVDLLQPSSPNSKNLRIPPTSPSLTGPLSPGGGTTSPRLMAQAVRNSTANRLVSSGSGAGANAPPVVRATRVFSPETDPTKIKTEGLAALERFVAQMEGGPTPTGSQPASPTEARRPSHDSNATL